MFTKEFLLATAERTVRSCAAVLIGFFTADATGVYKTLDWGNVAQTTLYTAAATVLFCLIGSQVGGNPGPAFGTERLAADPPSKLR